MNFAEPVMVDWNPANKVYVNLYQKLTRLKRTQPALEDGANRGALKIYSTNDEVYLLTPVSREITKYWYF